MGYFCRVVICLSKKDRNTYIIRFYLILSKKDEKDRNTYIIRFYLNLSKKDVKIQEYKILLKF